jgi:hypothetical protein
LTLGRNFESRDKLRGNTHVILFPNLDDADIEKMVAKMKTDLTLEETDVLDGNKKVLLDDTLVRNYGQ